METKESRKIGIEGKPKYRYKSQFSSIEGNYNRHENHEFVVPWQMPKTEKKEIVMF